MIGIYTIKNKTNSKQYIGSSKDIGKRWKGHISKLDNNNHTNPHLQAAWNKYGSEAFSFEILEECLLEEVIEIEQKWIDSFDFDNLYNLTKIAYGGGADTLSKELCLLNLKGKLINCFKSGTDLARYLNTRQIVYRSINTPSKIFKKYRIVTPDFYSENLELIKSWNNPSRKQLQEINRKKRVQKRRQEKRDKEKQAARLRFAREQIKAFNRQLKENEYLFVITKDEEEITIRTFDELSLFTGLTIGVCKGLKQTKLWKSQGFYFHEQSGYLIKR